jgi:hypothetical protein
MQRSPAVELDPAHQVRDLDRRAREAPRSWSEGLIDRFCSAGPRDVPALASVGVSQGGQGANRRQLKANAIDMAGEALRAPTRRESLRVAPGTLEEPGA